MNKYIDNSLLLIALCIILGLSSCNRSQNLLQRAEAIMESNPDSALTLLRGIKNPNKLSKCNHALYTLLMAQAMDKKQLEITDNAFLDDAVQYFCNANDSLHAVRALYYAGKVNDGMKNAEQATLYYLKASDWAKNGSDYRCKFLINYYLGALYYDQLLYKDGLAVYREALRIANRQNNNVYRSFALAKIGYGFSGLERNDSALVYNLQALEVASKYSKENVSTILKQIIYAYQQIKRYDIALKYCNEALVSLQDSEPLYSFYCFKGEIFNDLHQYDSAVYYLNKSFQDDLIYTKASVCSELSQVYKGKNNPDKALYYMEQFNNYRDTIDKQTRSAAVIQMQTLYKHGKLQEENALLKETDLQKKKWIYLICFLSTLLLSLSGVAYFLVSNRKQKLIRVQEEQIRFNKEQIRLQEIEKLQSDKRIAQQELKEVELRETFYRQLNFVSVPELRGISEKRKREVNEHIRLTEDDWAHIIENTNATFNGFVGRLKNTFPKLSDADIQLCCLVKMQLKQADIAEIFNVEKDSVKKRKMRIRKDKMCLDGDKTLDETLRDF
nr:hypothetical protein [uncultured Bacteroides sp.]